MLIYKSNQPSNTLAGDFSVRSFRASDRADVFHLYTHGLLGGHRDQRDNAADLADIEKSYFQHPQNHLWVAEANGSLIGMVAISQDAESVMHVRRLRVAPLWQLESRVAIALIRTATTHARVHGCLKLVFHTSMDTPKAIELLDGLGLQLSRIRDREGQHLIELYDNLYARQSETPSVAGHMYPPAH